MNINKLIAEDLLRCHLGALIEMAGMKIPPGLKAHPIWQDVASSELTKLVDIYKTFLRSPKSI